MNRLTWQDYINPFVEWCYRVRHVVPIIGYPLHKNERFSPVFIIGSGRSGNTLLRRILSTKSELHIPPETYVLGTIIKFFSVNRNLAWRDLLFSTFSQFEYYPEFDKFEITLRPLVQNLADLPKEKRTLAYILDAFYRFHAEQRGVECKRWGDKTPINTFSLDRIHAVFPNAQYVHVIRDGCDVVSSYCQSGIYNNILDAAERWTTSIKAAQKFIRAHPGSCFEIRYESLVSKPDSTVKSLCEFLALSYDADMLNVEQVNLERMGDVLTNNHHEMVRQPISSLSIGKGRCLLTIGQMRQIKPVLNPLLSELGYDLCTS